MDWLVRALADCTANMHIRSEIVIAVIVNRDFGKKNGLVRLTMVVMSTPPLLFLDE